MPPLALTTFRRGTTITSDWLNAVDETLVGPVHRNVIGEGADPTGATSSLTAFTTQIDAAATAGGGRVTAPRGLYDFATPLTIKEGVTLGGDGLDVTTLRFADASGTAAIVTPSASVTDIALASNLVEGSRTAVLTGGGGASFAVGDWLYLFDDDTALAQAPGGGHQYNNGSFLTRVQAKATDTLTLEEASPCTFLTSENAKARAITGGLRTGVVIENLTIRVGAGTGPATALDSLISLSYCDRPTVRNVRVIGAQLDTIRLLYCRNPIVENVTCEYAGVVVGSGYAGVWIEGCTRAVVRSVETRNCPFGVVATASPYTSVTDPKLGGRVDTALSSGRGIKFQSGSNYSKATGGEVTDFALIGVYVVDSWGCYVGAGLTVFGTGSSTSEVGIQVGGFTADRAHDNTVEGAIVRYVGGIGIRILPTSGAATATFNKILGCSVSETGDAGIVVGSSDNDVIGNTVRNWGSGQNGISAAASTLRNKYTENRLNGSTGYAISTSGSGGTNQVQDNYSNRVFSVHSTDKTRNNVGFVTEIRGLTATIASGTTSVVRNHGLNVTPNASDFQVVPTNNPTNDPGHWWIDTITSTQFTLNVRADPGVSTATFSLSAAVL